MADTSQIPPAVLSRHQRWPEPSGASTKRVYAMRIRRGIGPAGRAERKRLKRKVARDKFKAAHPNRKKELAAAKALAAIEASRRSFKLWFAAPLSAKAALAFVQESIIPDPEGSGRCLPEADRCGVRSGRTESQPVYPRSGRHPNGDQTAPASL